MGDGWYIKCFCENRKGCDTVIATFVENGKCSPIIYDIFCHNNQYTEDEYYQKLIEWLEEKKRKFVRFDLEDGLYGNIVTIN